MDRFGFVDEWCEFGEGWNVCGCNFCIDRLRCLWEETKNGFLNDRFYQINVA